MRSKLQQGAGWLIQQLVILYFVIDDKTKPIRDRIFDFLYDIWGKYPALKQDILHSAVSMSAFCAVVIGHANDVRWLFILGTFGLVAGIVLGSINLFYDFSKAGE